MAQNIKQQLLANLPSISNLLEDKAVVQWLEINPRQLVADCLRDTVDELRNQILNDSAGKCGMQHITSDFILKIAAEKLACRTKPQVRKAINATGIILHTALGRAVWPACVVDSMVDELKGYVTLAIDREIGQRSERDHRIEYILTELTGAEAATIVNNNAAATILALAACAAGKEAIVSRGQLIEIGGSFRLPDVMAQSGAKMVEVGTTNRTHLRDYQNAINENTAIILRVHPSNYRILGFASQPELVELAELAHAKGLVLIDDLGAGALVGLEQFGLPHELTIKESIQAGADIVLCSGDKLMGASQAGIIVGKKALIEKIRKHPLARAFRVDKTCLMALERTLHLFRDVKLLCRKNPTYQMLTTPLETLVNRAEKLKSEIDNLKIDVEVSLTDGVGYLGSGSLPMEQLPTRLVALTVKNIKAAELARRLRLDDACIFTRIEKDQVIFDVRTLTDEQVPQIAAAVKRAMQ